jgi:hypothetical protein
MEKSNDLPEEGKLTRPGSEEPGRLSIKTPFSVQSFGYYPKSRSARFGI